MTTTGRPDARAMLRELEWSQPGGDCPVCRRGKWQYPGLEGEHKPDCRLAAAPASGPAPADQISLHASKDYWQHAVGGATYRPVMWGKHMASHPSSVKQAIRIGLQRAPECADVIAALVWQISILENREAAPTSADPPTADLRPGLERAKEIVRSLYDLSLSDQRAEASARRTAYDNVARRIEGVLGGLSAAPAKGLQPVVHKLSDALTKIVAAYPKNSPTLAGAFARSVAEEALASLHPTSNTDRQGTHPEFWFQPPHSIVRADMTPADPASLAATAPSTSGAGVVEGLKFTSGTTDVLASMIGVDEAAIARSRATSRPPLAEPVTDEIGDACNAYYRFTGKPISPEGMKVALQAFVDARNGRAGG